MENPKYTATRSAWSAVTILRVLFFWLIIPLIIMIVDILKKKYEKIEFYEEYIIHRQGVLSKSERRIALVGIAGISLSQSLKGRIFDYGDLIVDVVGRWDLDTNDIKEPRKLKEYLERYLVKASTVQSVIAN